MKSKAFTFVAVLVVMLIVGSVAVYAYDSSAGKKHATARDILVDLWDSGRGLLSTQVLQEFFVIATSKVAKPLDPKDARRIVADLLKWSIVVNDGDSILGATDIHLRYRYSFWDSLIIHAALSGGASLLLSEDMAHGQTIESTEIRNPFVSG